MIVQWNYYNIKHTRVSRIVCEETDNKNGSIEIRERRKRDEGESKVDCEISRRVGEVSVIYAKFSQDIAEYQRNIATARCNMPHDASCENTLRNIFAKWPTFLRRRTRGIFAKCIQQHFRAGTPQYLYQVRFQRFCEFDLAKRAASQDA